MEWDKIAKATNDLYKQRAQTLLATLQQETEALEGHDDRSEEKYIAAREAMGGPEAIEALRPQYETAARAIKSIREGLVPSWVAFQSLTITNLYRHCLHAQVVFKHTIDTLIATLAKKGIPTTLSAPDSLKKMERAIVKMEIKYGGDVSRLTDVFRCTLVFDSLKDLYLAVQFIAVSPDLRGPAGAVVTDIEDRFLNPLPKQYGDVLLQMVVDGECRD